MCAALVFNFELNFEFEFEQVSEHLPASLDWRPIHLLQSQRNSKQLFPPWTTWETRRGGADESVRCRTPSPTLLLRSSLLLLLPPKEQPPHDPDCIMCPRKRVKTEVGSLSRSSMAESPQQEEDTVSNMSNGAGLNSVESRLGQISATLESLSTELAILIASRRRGEEGDNMLLKEVESTPMEMVMESNKTTTKGGSSVVESAGGLRKSSVVRLNVGG